MLQRADGSLRLRPFFGLLGLSTIMSLVLVVVVYCAGRIFVVLHANLSMSKKGPALQRQLYYTLLVQFVVPFCVMYDAPVVLPIFPTLLRIGLTFPEDLLPVIFSVYPSLDALVIMFGVHDYRIAAAELFGCRRAKEKSTSIFVMSAMPSATIATQQ